MIRMIQGTEDLLYMNFCPVNPETLQTECNVLTLLNARFPVSTHPFAILPKTALLTTDTVTNYLTAKHREKLHNFLLNSTAGPSRLPQQTTLRELLDELRTPPPSPLLAPRALTSPIDKHVTRWCPAEWAAVRPPETCSVLQ